MLKKKKTGNIIIVYPEGRLDVTRSTELEEEITKLIEEEGARNIIMNLENVEYMSSSGFRACIAILRKLKSLNGNFKISNVRPSVKRIFDVIELTSLFDIYETEEEAIKSIQ
ncbi:MAG: anti-sigma factor antagonist [Leptospiraceae bacterium]|nr:MAG: anti-sigma factor antagonist [Leptospiraceae bacterium]